MESGNRRSAARPRRVAEAKARLSEIRGSRMSRAHRGGGWLVLGVRDDRTHQALTPGQLDSVAEMVTEICSDSIRPPLD